MGDSEGELEQVGYVSDEFFLERGRAEIPRRPLCHAKAGVVALREVGLAAHLIALVREHLDDTGEDTVNKLTSDLLRSVGRSCVHSGHLALSQQEALLHLQEHSLLLLPLPLEGHSSLKSRLDGGKTGAKCLTGTVDESG